MGSAASWIVGVVVIGAGVGVALSLGSEGQQESVPPKLHSVLGKAADGGPATPESGDVVVASIPKEAPVGSARSPRRADDQRRESPSTRDPGNSPDPRSQLRVACEGSLRWHASMDRSLFRVVWRKPHVQAQERSMHLQPDGRFRMFRVDDLAEIDVLVYLDGDRFPLETFLGVPVYPDQVSHPHQLQGIDLTAARKRVLRFVHADGASVNEPRHVQTLDAGGEPLMHFVDESNNGTVDVLQRFPQQEARVWARGCTPQTISLDHVETVRLESSLRLTVVLEYEYESVGLPLPVHPQVAPLHGDYSSNAVVFSERWRKVDRKGEDETNPDITTFTVDAEGPSDVSILSSAWIRRSDDVPPQATYAIAKPGKYRVTWAVSRKFSNAKPIVVDVDVSRPHRTVTVQIDRNDLLEVVEKLQAR